MCEQKWTGLEDRTMEENDGFGFWIWGVAEVIDISIGTEATDDGGARDGVNGMALGSDGDFTVVADPDFGLLAPNQGPPRTGGNWA